MQKLMKSSKIPNKKVKQGEGRKLEALDITVTPKSYIFSVPLDYKYGFQSMKCKNSSYS